MLTNSRATCTYPPFFSPPSSSSTSSSRLPRTKSPTSSHFQRHCTQVTFHGPSLTNIDLLPPNLLASPNSPAYRGPFLPRPSYFICSLPPSSRPFSSTPPRLPPPAPHPTSIPVSLPLTPPPHPPHLPALDYVQRLPSLSAVCVCCVLRAALCPVCAVCCGLLCVVCCVRKPSIVTLPHKSVIASPLLPFSCSTNTRQSYICSS